MVPLTFWKPIDHLPVALNKGWRFSNGMADLDYVALSSFHVHPLKISI